MQPVCAEVQAQSVRTNRETVIQTLNLARRAGIDACPYFERLAQPPLNPTYDSKIQYGHDIQTGLTKLAQDLQNDLDQNADWNAYHKREDAILIVTTGMDGNIDEAAFVSSGGQTEVSRHYIHHGKSETLRHRSVIDTGKAQSLFQRCQYLQQQDTRMKPLSPDPHRGSLYLDYHGRTSCDLMTVDDDNSNQIIMPCQIR